MECTDTLNYARNNRGTVNHATANEVTQNVFIDCVKLTFIGRSSGYSELQTRLSNKARSIAHTAKNMVYALQQAPHGTLAVGPHMTELS